MAIYNIPENIPKTIFRTYDIRGIVGEQLGPDLLYAIGLAIGSEAHARGQQQLAIGRDGRLSGPLLCAALKAGILDSGRDLIDIGLVPTPVLYFATHFLGTQSGLILTGSHNPSDYNGIKIVLEGNTLAESDIQALYDRMVARNFVYGKGKLEERCIGKEYIERITQDVKLKRPMKIVIDAGNGAAGEIAPILFRALGCEVIELFCEIDGHFPNHHPDPTVEANLTDLRASVLANQADIGLAFDGDGDRLGILTNKGELIWPDRQMMLFAQDVLTRQPGAEILFDVKCTMHLPRVIEKAGGKPFMWKTGHSLLKAKMREKQAPLAGEMSGHIFFKERWYGFDDGLYAGARLLEILSQTVQSVEEVFRALPNSVNTPEIKVMMRSEKDKVMFMESLIQVAKFSNATVNQIDGIRADFQDGWGLVRASNTTPCLTLRFEGDSVEAVERIKREFRENLLCIDSQLEITF
ncbi:MAG: phosphomannomutase/phosphoglucomutase [Gammaproteobacteria bacterium]|jgi:phosphomannomutase/phosphoglucomutase|nr:phosphomannomutase/phosphoglucomutase [Gammaproteobacteria bacterium]